MIEKDIKLSFVPIAPPPTILSAGLLTSANVFPDKPDSDPTGENLKKARYKFVQGQLEWLEKKNDGLRLRFPDLEQEKRQTARPTYFTLQTSCSANVCDGQFL